MRLSGAVSSWGVVDEQENQDLTDSHQPLVAQMAKAIVADKPLPAITAALTLEQAYRVQIEMVRKVSPGGIAGLKAGVTTAAARKHFGLTHGLMGELYAFGSLDPDDPITVNPESVIECEIGILIDGAGNPLSAGPAIEFACANFARPQDLTAANLVAGNLGAYRFIRGSQQPWRNTFNDVRVQLSRDGELINEASMQEALGGPERALPWMLEEAALRGLPIEQGMLLMTGTCGQPAPALPGNYVADYGDFGQVSFTIVEAPAAK